MTSTDPRLEKEPIAIVGMGCGFPGARDLDAFWRLLCEGKSTITEVMPDRWDVDAFYDPDPEARGKTVGRWGGYLRDLDLFDARFFEISPREAPHLDPRQRLMLEVTWEALENAGIAPDRLSGSQTGVFIAILRDDYGLRLFEDFDIVEVYSGTGNANSAAANRISYFFNLHGPSMAIDTACSGSSVAIHLACQSLRDGESSLALAGGVSVILEPDSDIFFSRAGALSPDGRCRTFDSHANGTVRAEGAGIVVLKLLPQALADGDHIHAVIRGSAVNHCGRSQGIMAPSEEAQAAVVREAYRQANISPGRVQYVEAHGTGTRLGDPVEVRALGAVLTTDRQEGHECILGSLKPNLGHTEAASGIAGVIKVVLAMQHRLIPPNLYFQEPNPLIPFDRLPFIVPQSLMPWPRPSEPMIAGVSSFGFSGTNAHLVLEEFLQEAVPGRTLQQPCLLPLSAKTREALRALAMAYRGFLTREAENAPELHDVCYTAGTRRTHFTHRLALVGGSRDELVEQIDAYLAGEDGPGLSVGVKPLDKQAKLVFVFSGQGSHWLGMGRELMQREPVFRKALEECDQILERMAGWSLLDELTANESDSRLNSTDITQPAVFSLQVALAALWRSWGLVPDVVVGHSLGEAAAAHVSGALSLEEAMSVVYHRGRLMKRVEGKGKTAVVGLPLKEARLALAVVGDLVSVAGSNSPTSSVISGEPDTIESIVKSLSNRDVFCRVLQGVDIAFHSPQMDPLKEELAEALGDIRPRPTTVPLFSTVTAAPIDGAELDAEYWARNLRDPFLFTDAVQQLVQSGCGTFLEVSPHPVLVTPISQGLEALGREGVVLPSLRRDKPEMATMLATLGTLYTIGHTVDWHRLYPEGRSVAAALPTYPWQREHYWLDQLTDKPLGASAQLSAKDRPKRAGNHPLLGEHVRMAAAPWGHLWEIDLDAGATTYLPDHQVWGAVVMPGAGYLEMALAAAQQAFGPGMHAVEQVAFKRMLYLSQDVEQRVQVVLTPETMGEATFQVFSSVSGGTGSADGWVEHVSGTVRTLEESDAAPEPVLLDEIRARCKERITGTDQYEMIHAGGLLYGPNFQAVRQIWRRDGEALGQLELPPPLISEFEAYHLHPVLLDAAFQTVAASSPSTPENDGAAGDTFLPASIRSLRVYRQPSTHLWCHAIPNLNLLDGNVREADVFLLDENGEVVAVVDGLRATLIAADRESLDHWMYELQWKVQPLVPVDLTQRRQPGTWLVFTDSAEAEPLTTLLAEQGETCILIHPGETYQAAEDGLQYWINPEAPEDYVRLIEEALPINRPPCRGIVHRWSGLAAATEMLTLGSLDTAQTLGAVSVLFLAQALLTAHLTVKPRLWLVTRGARAVTPGDVVSPVQAPVWGIGRTIAEEQVELRCSLVDLNTVPSESETHALLAELWADQPEDQIALRGGVRHVARFERYGPTAVEAEEVFIASKEAPFHLEIVTPGKLDSLTAWATQRREPGPGEVEIKVSAAGLGSRDVMLAKGLLSSSPDGTISLGMECAGHIVAVGEGVGRFEVGDEVVACAQGCLSRYVTANAHCVSSKPVPLSFEQAATVPVAFATAYHALSRLAQLRAGERVLIHTAADAVGQAAIQLARLAGAEIFAATGTPEERTYLQERLDVEHVIDSRTLDFADEIMELTGGEGVDVVLNTFSGGGIVKNLSMLKPYGRFLDLGGHDALLSNPMRLGLSRRNFSLFVVDLSQMLRDRPDYVGEILAELWPLFEARRLQPVPFRVYSISEVTEAFRAMAGHIGEMVISIQDQEVRIASPGRRPITIRDDGTYLVTGGLGGLGLVTARWLADKGAGSLVLMSRRGREGMSQQAAQTVQALEADGVQVTIAAGDVGKEKDVARVLSQVEKLPPLRGIIHAAGVVDDRVISQMTAQRFRRVMVPKVQGAWNLHALTREAPLDFLIFYSSIASIAAAAGQSNYAAGNAFMDALAHYRRSQGLPAMSINWGGWSDVGLLTYYPGMVEQVEAKGLLAIHLDQGRAMLDKLLEEHPAQVAAVPIDWVRFGQSWPAGYIPPVFSDLYEAEVGEAGALDGLGSTFVEEVLLTAPPGERLALLESHLQKLVAGVLRLDTSALDVHQPLNALGIDSLMALELRNRIKKSLGLPVSIADLLRGLSVADMAERLLPQLDIEEEDAEIAELLAELEQLPSNELAILLDDGRDTHE